MNFFKKIGQKLKSGLKKAVKSKLLGALVSVVPGVGPVLSAVAKAKAIKDQFKGAGGTPALKKTVKTAAKKAINQRISLASLDSFKSLNASSAGFGTPDNPLMWPVGNFPGEVQKVSVQKPNTNAQALRSLNIAQGKAMQMSAVGGSGLPKAIAKAGPMIKTYGPGLIKMGKKAAEALGYIVTGGWIFDQAGSIIGQVKKPKMNYMNGKAAKRAVRRIKGVRKICHSIERMLPKSKSSGRRYGGPKSCR